VQPDISQPGGCADTGPCGVDSGAQAIGPHARDHSRVVCDAREFLEQRAGRSIEIHHLRAGLAVGEPQALALEIDLFPTQIDDLAATAPGQQQQLDRGARVGIARSLRFLVERQAE